VKVCCRARSGETKNAVAESHDRGDDLQEGSDMQCRALEILLWVRQILWRGARSDEGQNALDRCCDGRR
jgi:hypothetical protein